MINLVEQHLQIWNEQNALKRLALMNEVYAANIEMVDSHFIATGLEAVNSFIEKLHTENPDFRFSHSQPISSHHNIARLYWEVGSTEKPAAVKGMDIFVIENGKISKLYVFVEA